MLLTVVTWAPQRCSRWAHSGPAHKAERSMTFACDSPRGADSIFVSDSRLGALSKNSTENSAKAFDATNARERPISRPRSVKAIPLRDATALVSISQLLSGSSIASQELSNSQSLSRGRFTPSQPSTQLSSRQVPLAEPRPCGAIPSSCARDPNTRCADGKTASGQSLPMALRP